VHHPAHPCLGRGERVQLRTKQVNPEIPVYRDPQETLVDADEGGCLRNSVGDEVVQLHPVVVAQSTHKAARRHGEAALVMPDETDDAAVRRVGLPIRHRWNDPRRGYPSTFGASWPPFTSSFRVNCVTIDRFHGSGGSTWIGWVGAIVASGGT
jgi:hypothetical protein